MKPATRLIRKRLSDAPPPPTKKDKTKPAKAGNKLKRVNPKLAKAKAEMEKAKKSKMSKAQAAQLRQREARHAINSTARDKAREKFRKEQALIALARKRREMGLPPSEAVTITMPAHQQMALQVRAGAEKQWSTVIGIKYYPGMSHSRKDCTCKACLIEKLTEKKTGWQTSQYFGADAQFRIEEVTVPKQMVHTSREAAVGIAIVGGR